MRILYVDVDSLRPDHTTPYGYERPLTPNLQSVADSGVTMERFYCSDSPCVPSRAAFSTQRFGIDTGAVGHYGSDAEVRFLDGRSHRPDAPFLGGHLTANSFFTAGISCFAERHLAYWFHGNFQEFRRPTLSLGLDEDASDVTDAAIAWIDDHQDEENWFLFLNYWDTHADYMIDEEWVAKAQASGPPPAWPDAATIEQHQSVYGMGCAVDLHDAEGSRSRVPSMPDSIRNRDDFEKLIDSYDGAVAYWDHHFGRLLEHLRSRGIHDDVAIIVTADHGEAFGEQGIYAEHAMAHEPCHHVPLVLRWPGVTDDLPSEARKVAGLQYNLDLGPTLCDLLEISTPTGWHGESFADAVRGKPHEGRDHVVLSHGVHSYQRAVRTADDKMYIQTLHPGTYGVDPEELYDLSVDPHLTENTIESQPEVARDMRSLLQEWWNTYAGRPGSYPDPLQSALRRGPVLYSDPRRYIQHLIDTDRAELAEDYKKRLGKFLDDPIGFPAHELHRGELS